MAVRTKKLKIGTVVFRPVAGGKTDGRHLHRLPGLSWLYLTRELDGHDGEAHPQPWRAIQAVNCLVMDKLTFDSLIMRSGSAPRSSDGRRVCAARQAGREGYQAIIFSDQPARMFCLDPAPMFERRFFTPKAAGRARSAARVAAKPDDQCLFSEAPS